MRRFTMAPKTSRPFSHSSPPHRHLPLLLSTSPVCRIYVANAVPLAPNISSSPLKSASFSNRHSQSPSLGMWLSLRTRGPRTFSRRGNPRNIPCLRRTNLSAPSRHVLHRLLPVTTAPTRAPEEASVSGPPNLGVPVMSVLAV